MLKFYLCAAIVLNSSAVAFAGQTFVQPDKTVVSYTFESPNGVKYCDGLTLTQKSNMATGYHTGSCLGSPLPFAGGFSAHVVNLPPGAWAITTTDPRNPTFTLVYLIDEGNLTYSAWYEIGNSTSFRQGAYGALGIGTPPNGRGLTSSTAMMK